MLLFVVFIIIISVIVVAMPRRIGARCGLNWMIVFAPVWTASCSSTSARCRCFVSPYAFRVDLSIFFFFSVVVGGNGQLVGPLVGAWILYLVPNALLADLSTYRLLGYGIVALLIMLAFPDGVVGSLEKMRRRHRLRERIGGIAVDRLFGWSGRRAANSSCATGCASPARWGISPCRCGRSSPASSRPTTIW